MTRIIGVDIPDHLKVEYALQVIYGIGKTNVWEVIEKAKLDSQKRAKELTDEEIGRIQKVLEDYLIQGDLRRQISQNINRLVMIKSYRGSRHSAGLPVRGQRTKTNARTKRGSRKTVGAFKKDEKAKQAPAAKPAAK